MSLRSAGKRLGVAIWILLAGLPVPGGGGARAGEPTGWRTPLDPELAKRGRTGAYCSRGF